MCRIKSCFHYQQFQLVGFYKLSEVVPVANFLFPKTLSWTRLHKVICSDPFSKGQRTTELRNFMFYSFFFFILYCFAASSDTGLVKMLFPSCHNLLLGYIPIYPLSVTNDLERGIYFITLFFFLGQYSEGTGIIIFFKVIFFFFFSLSLFFFQIADNFLYFF